MWQSPSCGSPRDLAVPRIWATEERLARIWLLAGCGSHQDVAAARNGHPPGFDRRQHWGCAQTEGICRRRG